MSAPDDVIAPAAREVDWKALKVIVSRTVAQWAARQVMHVEQPPLSTVLCQEVDKFAAALAAAARGLEAAAAVQHDIWSHWMRWFFENDTPENRERWRRQMTTHYADLSEREKESDRKVVREFMPWAAARECVYTESKDGVWQCSTCTWDVSDDLTESTWAYCPHCGARITESRAYVEEDDDDTE